jgi:hypothetical protein
LRASYQQLDSESDKEKHSPFAILGKEYSIEKRYVNLALAYGKTWTSGHAEQRRSMRPVFHQPVEMEFPPRGIVHDYGSAMNG